MQRNFAISATISQMTDLKDHREIGREQDLFAVSEDVGGGLPLFTPKGTILRRQIQNFIEELQKDLTYYQEVWIPHMAKPSLYKLSGHLEKYPEHFRVTSSAGDEFILKPMDCPHHMEIFNSRLRSYRELPLAYKEFTTNYRDEQSGELNGLLRVRSLTIDDCHIFCTEEQVTEEATKVYKTICGFYAAFNFEVKVRLSLRDPENKEKYIGDDATWEKSENVIRELAKQVEFDNFEGVGEAAFYGPKLDFMIKDSLDREWQLATIQLDYLIPKRLGVKYTDRDGQDRNPVVIHRAIAGSIERFIGILIEQYQGAFPLWLSPVQIEIVPLTDRNTEYAKGIMNLVSKAGIRAHMDDRSETMQAKIRDAELQKVPYIVVVGDNEQKTGDISIRSRGRKDIHNSAPGEFVNKITEAIAKRAPEIV